MPLYDIHHVAHLSEAQRDAIADGITTIHSEIFVTPRLFVNVVFHDAKKGHAYIAGKKRPNNRIDATVRAGGNRTPEMFDEMCRRVYDLWGTQVGTKGDDELRAIFVLGSLIGGSEAGLVIPKAGEDEGWLANNMAIIKKKAAEGDQEFAEMLEEVHARGMVKDVNGH